MSPFALEPSPKLGRLACRVIPVEETEARLRALLPKIPVTRISDLTPLDPLGLPVYSAVTPLARDLTSHMGKGLDAASARVSALMEAVERVSAETAPPHGTLRATFEELAAGTGPRPVDPASLDLPDDTLYAPDRPLTWIESHDLASDSPVLLAADLALSPPSEGVLREVDTNGLASGNTHMEAVVHALCEVIERDARSQLDFAALFGDSWDPRPPAVHVDPGTLPETAGFWVERIRSASLDVTVLDVTSDLGVPTFHCLLLDRSYPSPEGLITRGFGGWGTAPDAELAVLRSITEAVQSRLGYVQGARDSYNVTPFGRRPATHRERLRQLMPAGRVPFSRTVSFRSADLRDDLRFLLRQLAAAGLGSVIATDLTRPDLGIPVVRVRVPGLACFTVNRRRVGWRCLRHLL